MIDTPPPLVKNSDVEVVQLILNAATHNQETYQKTRVNRVTGFVQFSPIRHGSLATHFFMTIEAEGSPVGDFHKRLHQTHEASRKGLSPSEVSLLVDVCLDLLKDNNFRVSQGAMQALDSAAVLSGDHLKLHLNAIVPRWLRDWGMPS